MTRWTFFLSTRFLAIFFVKHSQATLRMSQCYFTRKFTLSRRSSWLSHVSRQHNNHLPCNWPSKKCNSTHLNECFKWCSRDPLEENEDLARWARKPITTLCYLAATRKTPKSVVSEKMFGCGHNRQTQIYPHLQNK